jgi:hypothetical protein
LIRELGDESGGVMPDVRTPVGTTRLIALSMINSSDLAAAMHRAIEFNRVCRVRDGAEVINRLLVDEERRQATLTYFCDDDAPEVQHSVLCNLAMWMRFNGWLIDQHIDVTSAHLRGPPAKIHGRYTPLFPLPGGV